MLDLPGRSRPYLRRAYSVAHASANSGDVEFLLRRVGPGTALLEEIPEGSAAKLLGPLGNGFSLAGLEGGKRVAVVAGGIGAAPFPLLFDALSRAGIAADFYLGGRNSEDLSLAARFSGIVPGEIVLSSDDGSAGERGLVTEAFRRRAAPGRYARLFACGPMPMFSALAKSWDGLDGLVHAIAFAPREAIAGDFLEGLSREAFRIAHDVSAYSFAALAKAALPMMQGRNGALVTLTYLGAERVVPNYNTMGLAKASLEAGVRYLATSLGPRGIRVNAISAGPIKTLAASGISGFSKILKHVEENAPLRRNVTTEDVGNVAAFLLSDLAASVTGEVIHADAGFSTVVGGMAGDAGPPPG